MAARLRRLLLWRRPARAPCARPGARVSWPAGALVATLAVGLLVEHAAHSGDPVAAVGDLAVAVAFVACGATVWTAVRTSDLTGPLMVATGAAWLAGSVSDELALVHRGPLIQLLVAAPGGRPRSRVQWLVVVAGYVAAVVPAIGRADGVTAVLAVLVVGVAIGRWARAGGLQRRARAVPAAAATAIGLVLIAGAVGADGEAVLWAYEAVLVTTAGALLADLRWGAGAQSAVTALVIDLGDMPRKGSLTAALARAVGDPSLVVGYRLEDGRFADERGRPVTLPDPGLDRAVTTVVADGAPAAVMLHDPAALRAPGLSDGVAAAVRLALDNVRLEADIRARVKDVEASRGRLLHARDAERRRLEALLSAGVGHRLEAAADALRALADDPDEVLSALPGELDRTRAELHRFASGLHPRALRTGGLAAALPELAAHAPLPVEVKVECGRLETTLEAAAWFVCSEGLANIAKHAAATRAAIGVRRERGRIVVTVDDDGRGGADQSVGRGLRGLAARVEAVGGGLDVDERPAGGTRVRATFPMKEAT